MGITDVLSMIGGLALFLYGMSVMGDGLAKISGGKLETILEKLTSNRLKAVLLGAFVTALIQSSSATTVMVVGFVNSGIMQLGQAVGIIMGANIGTTITSWILSLTGLSGDNIFITLLKPTSFSPVLAAIGIVMCMTAKNNPKKKDIGEILLGFAVLMYGMHSMSSAVSPLAGNEHFTSILTMFSNPVLGMIAGLVLTAVIQSSSASVGILQALCITGAVPYGAAIPIIMGQNIGTCVTALISSIGASKNAKRASMIHLYFNLIGTIIFMVGFYAINSVVHFEFLARPANVFGIAVVHSLFNIGCAIVLFPCANLLVKLATLTVKDSTATEAEEETEVQELPAALRALDERFLETPAFAMELCRTAGNAMAEQTRSSILVALNLIRDYNENNCKYVIDKEAELDVYEEVLGSYLVKLSSKELTIKDSRCLTILLHCISDIERISDYAFQIALAARELHDKDLHFSSEARTEIEEILQQIDEIVSLTIDSFTLRNIEEAGKISELDKTIENSNVDHRQNHINRLRSGKCTIDIGLILEDLLTDFERISAHCSNIGVCMVQVSADGFNIHS